MSDGSNTITSFLYVVGLAQANPGLNRHVGLTRTSHPRCACLAEQRTITGWFYLCHLTLKHMCLVVCLLQTVQPVFYSGRCNQGGSFRCSPASSRRGKPPNPEFRARRMCCQPERVRASYIRCIRCQLRPYSPSPVGMFWSCTAGSAAGDFFSLSSLPLVRFVASG